MSGKLNSKYFRMLYADHDSKWSYIGIRPIGYPMVLFSLVDGRPLVVLTLRVQEDYARRTRASNARAIISTRPKSSAVDCDFQGIITADNAEFELVISNLCDDGYINFNIFKGDTMIGLNEINELRPDESYAIQCDQATNRSLVIRALRTETGKRTTVREDEDKAAETQTHPKGTYFNLSVVPSMKSELMRKRFQKTKWVCCDTFCIVRKRNEPSRPRGRGHRFEEVRYHHPPPGELRGDFNFFGSASSGMRARGGNDGIGGRPSGHDEEFGGDMLMSGGFMGGPPPAPAPQMGRMGHMQSNIAPGPQFGAPMPTVGLTAPSLGGLHAEMGDTEMRDVEKETEIDADMYDDSEDEGIMLHKQNRRGKRECKSKKKMEPSTRPYGAERSGLNEDAVMSTYAAEVSGGREIEVHGQETGIDYDYENASARCILGLSVSEALQFMDDPPEQFLLQQVKKTISDMKSANDVALVESLDKIYKEENCVICLDAAPDAVFYQCGHQCCHFACSDEGNVRTCPMCRGHVSAKTKVEVNNE